jgi:membrane-bound serine protease (ClpP class)
MLTILASLGIIVLGARAVGLAFGHRLVLGDGLGGDGGQSEELLGLEGAVIAPLRPAGIGRFGLKRLDITSRNEFLRRGAHVRIIGLEGNRIVVEALED